MPGLAMDPNQSGIKDELEDTQFIDTDSPTYHPRPQLPKAFVCMRSLADLIKDLNDNKIDVNPEYQREVVWTADRMTGLVNSLMENFYVPPIILNKKSNTAPPGRPQDAVFVCVDGKQRLSSVRAFVQGLIPCHDHNDEKWWFAEGPTPCKRILSEAAQRMFLAKEFVSFEFEDLSPEQEEDLFARVQMGVQLSLAEKMRASTGPWQELARLYVDDFPDIYALMKDRARAKDFQLTLSCFSQILEVMHPAASDGVPILRTNHAALPKLLNNKGAVDDGLKSHLASVWNTFRDLIAQDPDTFTNANKYLGGVQTFAPIEMVAVTVLISQYMDTRNKRLLLGDIQAMREVIREKFKDLRLNIPMWRFIWDFVENLEGIRGAVDGTTARKTQASSATATAAATGPSSTLVQNAIEKDKGKAKRQTLTKSNIPKVLPPQEPFSFKREEGNDASPLHVRPLKRQRTDPDQVASTLVDSLPSQLQPPAIPFRSSTLSTAGPPPRSVTVTNTSSVPQASPVTWASLAEANAFTQLSSPTMDRKLQASNRTAPVSKDGQTTSTAESESYNASHAPMFSIAPQAPSDLSPGAPPVSSYSRSSRPPTTIRVGRPGHNIGPVPITSEHLRKQWGEVREETAQAGPSSMPSARRRMQKPLKTAPQPPPPLCQIDGVVDLTSDDEQEEERQNLLMSFGAKALASKDGRKAKTTAAAFDTAQLPPVNGTTQAQQAPIVGNNPYARFSQAGSMS